MEKQEFLKLVEAAYRAAKSASKDDNKSSPEVSRCIDVMNRLKKAPVSLACDALHTTTIGKSFRAIIDHTNPRIRSEARLLRDLWLSYLYATGEKPCGSDEEPLKNKTGDPNRDKVREVLEKKLAKVADEVVEAEMKTRVVACDPSTVAVSVESAMFEKLGCFMGPHKAKYRSILLNMGDSKNPDLRRKVLIGEISGERLVTMEREEMASEKMQREFQNIRERAKLREDERVKMMLQSDMIMT